MNRLKIHHLPPTLTIPGIACPQWYPGGCEAVLLLHGWTGYPGEMFFLGTYLHEAGYTVLIPRLPGHGTCGEDLLQCTWKDWLRAATDQYLNLRATYSTVHVVGFSMGGLLSLIIASQFPPKSMVLIAPAIDTHTKVLFLTALLKPFIKRFPYDHRRDQTDPGLRYIEEEYRRWTWIKPAAELYMLQRTTKKAMRHIETDILTVVSQKDTTVPWTVAEMVKTGSNGGRRESLILKESGHRMQEGEEKQKVAEAVVKWFRR